MMKFESKMDKINGASTGFAMRQKVLKSSFSNLQLVLELVMGSLMLSRIDLRLDSACTPLSLNGGISDRLCRNVSDSGEKQRHRLTSKYSP